MGMNTAQNMRTTSTQASTQLSYNFHTQQVDSKVFEFSFVFTLESCPKAQRQEAFIMNEDQNRQKCPLM